MTRAFALWLTRIWYQGAPVPAPLRWLEGLYTEVLLLRRWAYRQRLFTVNRLSAPVVVVGNLTVGGTGKTPVVAALARDFAERGWRPGVVLRGYRGRARRPTLLGPDTDAATAGDEAVLLYKSAQCPVAIGRDRARAGALLIERAGCNLVLSDDGLQHWALRRDFEIVVIDGERRFGNGRLLPAGPLREPAERLGLIDAVLVNGGMPGDGELPLVVNGTRAINLAVPGRIVALEHWRGRAVHAVAGIGNPARFFDMLRAAGIEVMAHPLPDHHVFAGHELDFDDALDVFVTEKDAVKCAAFASQKVYAVPVEAELPPGLVDRIHASFLEAPRARS